MDGFQQKTFELQCERCAACCRWPGEVRLSDAEVARLAGFLGLAEAEFIRQFTRLRRDRRGLALVEQPDGSCVFLDGKSCRVQAVKPEQCKEFPNRWVNSLWGRVPRAVVEREYPMLLNCQAFQTFLKKQGGEWAGPVD